MSGYLKHAITTHALGHFVRQLWSLSPESYADSGTLDLGGRPRDSRVERVTDVATMSETGVTSATLIQVFELAAI